MISIASKSNKRLIIEGVVNNKVASFLIDTGASVGLIDKNQIKKYGLTKGPKYNGTLVGAGGELSTPSICNDIIDVGNKKIN